MTELFLYDKEQGLFKKILNQSSVIEGRYHVSPSGGQDLNADNLDSFINDPKYGLSDPAQKYPLCVCMTPRSKFSNINHQRWEEFWFSLHFLTKTNVTADNQIKSLNKDTNTSGHHVWYDWQDMKNCADDFVEVLRMLLRTTQIVDGAPLNLHAYFAFDINNSVFTRLTKFNNDQVSGVSVAITLFMYRGECGAADYPKNIYTSIDMPPADIHPSHKQ